MIKALSSSWKFKMVKVEVIKNRYNIKENVICTQRVDGSMFSSNVKWHSERAIMSFIRAFICYRLKLTRLVNLWSALLVHRIFSKGSRGSPGYVVAPPVICVWHIIINDCDNGDGRRRRHKYAGTKEIKRS